MLGKPGSLKSCFTLPKVVENHGVPIHLHLDRSLQMIQSTLVIWKSKGPSKTLRDIRTSRYQICTIEGKTI